MTTFLIFANLTISSKVHTISLLSICFLFLPHLHLISQGYTVSRLVLSLFMTIRVVPNDLKTFSILTTSSPLLLFRLSFCQRIFGDCTLLYNLAVSHGPTAFYLFVLGHAPLFPLLRQHFRKPCFVS